MLRLKNPDLTQHKEPIFPRAWTWKKLCEIGLKSIEQGGETLESKELTQTWGFSKYNNTHLSSKEHEKEKERQFYMLRFIRTKLSEPGDILKSRPPFISAF